MTTTKEIERLEEIFKNVNSTFYNGMLKQPVITFNPDEKKKTLGHFIGSDIWKDNLKHTANEINIVCSLKRTKADLIETMLHECVHLFCHQNNIKDTSNNGVYHNKKYKEIANQHGLDVIKGKYGWNQTSLNESGKAFVATVKTNLGTIYRGVLTKPTKKQVVYKYTCPCCNAKFRATKELFLSCEGSKSESHELVPMNCERIDPNEEN